MNAKTEMIFVKTAKYFKTSLAFYYVFRANDNNNIMRDKNFKNKKNANH